MKKHGDAIAGLRGLLASTSLCVLGACGGGAVGFAAIAPSVVSLTATAPAGGKIVSTPDGLQCPSTCTAGFAAGTSVTLKGNAGDNYQFDTWTSGCTGTDVKCVLTMVNPVSVSASFAPIAPVTGAPYVDYTDIVSGPISGGENNQGAYLSLFGTLFGDPGGLGKATQVFIGGVEVANYRYLGPSKVAPRQGLQQLVVQVGALGHPTLGKGLPIKVVVNGVASNINNTFTPNPGRVLFVSLDGNDGTAAPDDITHPWRHLQTDSGGGLHASLRAGDQVVIRGGHWTDVGMDGAWLRFRYPDQQGYAPTGKGGTGWIHFTAYPGPIKGNAIEDVHYTTPANVKGGIQGANSAYFGTTGDYVAISNLRMDVDANATSDAAPINVQYSAGPWRVVNNELGPWPSKIGAKAAGVAGHGDGTTVLGNHIHDIACTGASENHGIYADSGALNWNIGYNWIENITGGNLIQFFDNVGLSGNDYTGYPPHWVGFQGMKVHHNWMDGSGKYGLNMADGIVSGVIWNNVVKGSIYAGLRINTISQNMDMTIAFNTFYDNDQLASGSGNAQVLNTWGNYGPTGVIHIHDNIIAAGPHTLKTSSYYENPGATDAYLDFNRNLYYDNGYGWSKFTRDPQAIFGNPKFVNAAQGDFHLATGSPAIDTGEIPVTATVDDFSSTFTRPVGGGNDLGAFEFKGS